MAIKQDINQVVPKIAEPNVYCISDFYGSLLNFHNMEMLLHKSEPFDLWHVIYFQCPEQGMKVFFIGY